MLRILSSSGGWWVRSQQRRYRPLGLELTREERQVMRGFFEDALLSGVRVHRLSNGDEPLWFRGIAVGPTISGITLVDTIVLAPSVPASGYGWSRLLFHELVHVVQFQLLGLDKFMAQYLDGWVTNKFRYRRIPLELNAWELEERFARDPANPFSVELEVRRQVYGSGRTET